MCFPISSPITTSRPPLFHNSRSPVCAARVLIGVGPCIGGSMAHKSGTTPSKKTDSLFQKPTSVTGSSPKGWAHGAVHLAFWIFWGWCVVGSTVAQWFCPVPKTRLAVSSHPRTETLPPSFLWWFGSFKEESVRWPVVNFSINQNPLHRESSLMKFESCADL